MNSHVYEVPENLTVATWEDLADSLLCSGLDSEGIKDALQVTWPGNEWFVFVQEDSEDFAFHRNTLFVHPVKNLCGKNMFAWKYSDKEPSCIPASKILAQSLIDSATYGHNPSDTQDDILSCRSYIVLRSQFN